MNTIVTVGKNTFLKKKLKTALVIRELAKINSHPKSVHSFWKITLIGGNGNKKSCTIHPERYTLAERSYRMDLWGCLEPILEAYGFGKDELLKLRNSLVEIH